MAQSDIVIVGGGLGGASLAGKLAGTGLAVTILERETEFRDRVRGEWMAPWGVAELQSLGLYERFREAGGHHITRHVGYDELIPADVAESMLLPVADLYPEIPGPMCMQHVVMQNEALQAAIESGVTVYRGVTRATVTAGANPKVNFRHEQKVSELRCRLVVGADGRSSSVRRELGIKLNEAPLDHLIAGLLIEGAHGWPEDLQSIGKVGDIQYLVFPQGGGRARLYADYAYTGRARYAGEGGAAEMLAAFDMECVPNSQAISKSTPIGPCRSYPSQDAWVDKPYVDGAVLMGDAAGYNDPILGQGLSVTLRDARMLAEILSNETDWSSSIFAPYAKERSERLRRLRYIASFITTLSARFEPADLARREAAFTVLAEDPELMNIAVGAYIGPEKLEARYFAPEFYQRVFGTQQYLVT